MANKKTWKKELAALMFAHIVWLSWMPDKEDILDTLAEPYIMFIAIAFGLDWHSKQSKWKSEDDSKS